MAAASGKKHHSYAFTSYLVDNLDKLESLVLTGSRKVLRFIGQEEICPNTDRLHLQAFIEFKDACSPELAKAFLARLLLGQCHVEAAFNPKAAHEYCKKKDKGRPEAIADGHDFFLQIGKDFAQGSRSDILECIQKFEELKSPDVDEFIVFYPQWYRLRPQILHRLNVINRIKARISFKKHRQYITKTVYVFWGPTGTGKTLRAYRQFPLLYAVPSIQGSNLWLDGYSNQSSILIDDFQPNLLTRQSFLQLTDHYPAQFPVKGSFISNWWSNILITSNFDPRTWYTDDCGICDPAVFRRLTNIIFIETSDDSSEYVSLTNWDPDPLGIIKSLSSNE